MCIDDFNYEFYLETYSPDILNPVKSWLTANQFQIKKEKPATYINSFKGKMTGHYDQEKRRWLEIQVKPLPPGSQVSIYGKVAKLLYMRSNLIRDEVLSLAAFLKASFPNTCPDCSAPIRIIGAKFCEYCGKALAPPPPLVPIVARSGKGLSNKAKKEAEQTGYATYRLTTLYAQPKSLQITPTKWDGIRSITGGMIPSVTPEIIKEIHDYLVLRDPSLIEFSNLGMEFASNIKFCFFSAQEQIYVEISDCYPKGVYSKADLWWKEYHIEEIDIFCDNEEHIRGIAQAINNLYKNGVVDYMDWMRFKDYFEVEKDDAIAAWKKWL